MVEDKRDRYIITAAHCLPHLPPPDSGSFQEQRTYQDLLGEIGGAAAIATECFFVDPVADVAVLGTPDNQTFYEQAEAYETLVESVRPFPITATLNEGKAWLLSLEGEWFDCKLDGRFLDGFALVCDSPRIAGGMSSSPVLNESGAAIGVVTNSTFHSSHSDAPDHSLSAEGHGPSLMLCLPGRFLKEFKRAKGRKR